MIFADKDFAEFTLLPFKDLKYYIEEYIYFHSENLFYKIYKIFYLIILFIPFIIYLFTEFITYNSLCILKKYIYDYLVKIPVINVAIILISFIPYYLIYFFNGIIYLIFMIPEIIISFILGLPELFKES